MGNKIIVEFSRNNIKKYLECDCDCDCGYQYCEKNDEQLIRCLLGTYKIEIKLKGEKKTKQLIPEDVVSRIIRKA